MAEMNNGQSLRLMDECRRISIKLYASVMFKSKQILIVDNTGVSTEVTGDREGVTVYGKYYAWGSNDYDSMVQALTGKHIISEAVVFNIGDFEMQHVRVQVSHRLGMGSELFSVEFDGANFNIICKGMYAACLVSSIEPFMHMLYKNSGKGAWVPIGRDGSISDMGHIAEWSYVKSVGMPPFDGAVNVVGRAFQYWITHDKCDHVDIDGSTIYFSTKGYNSVPAGSSGYNGVTLWGDRPQFTSALIKLTHSDSSILTLEVPKDIVRKSFNLKRVPGYVSDIVEMDGKEIGHLATESTIVGSKEELSKAMGLLHHLYSLSWTGYSVDDNGLLKECTSRDAQYMLLRSPVSVNVYAGVDSHNCPHTNLANMLDSALQKMGG